MTLTVERTPAPAMPVHSGSSAALRRWSWRLFRREWRQQILVLLLLVVAVGATVAGTAIAINAAPPSTTEVILPGTDPNLAGDIQTLISQAGGGTAVWSLNVTVPGSLNQISVRSENVSGAIGQAAVQVLSGRLPQDPDQVAMTRGVAAELGLSVGQTWSEGGVDRVLVGLIRNSDSYSDQYALLAPGQIADPLQVAISVPPGAPIRRLHIPGLGGLGIQATSSASKAAASLIVLTLSTLMLTFVGLIATAGFSVMAQRRLRALGMLAAVGATDRQVRSVMLANGLIVGAAAAVAGTAAGLVGWLIYAPDLATSVGHQVSRGNLEWWAVVMAIVLAVVTSLAAAWWPARRVARVSVVAALSGRPPIAVPTRRPAALGLGFLAVGLVLIAIAHHRAPLVVGGILLSAIGLLLVTPLTIRLAARLAGRSPLEVRLAVRDLARFEARSGGALRAITLAVVIAATICIVAARQEGLAPQQSYNLAANEMVVYLSPNGVGGPVPSVDPTSLATATSAVSGMAKSIGAKNDLELDQAVNLSNAAPGGQGFIPASLDQVVDQPNQFSDMFEQNLYVATPAVLQFYGVSGVAPDADVVSSLNDLQGLTIATGPNDFVDHPVIEHESALPTDGSDPSTLITENEASNLGLTIEPEAWLLRTASPLTGAQIHDAVRAAAAAGLTIETRSGRTTLTTVGNDMTAGGVILALGVLAMTIGLIRSETANDLRTLAATGASPRTRRSLTACTAAALAFLGALCGVAGAYVAMVAWFHSDLSSLRFIPWADLAVLLFGLPVLAAAGGWLFAGREPAGLGRRPLD